MILRFYIVFILFCLLIPAIYLIQNTLFLSTIQWNSQLIKLTTNSISCAITTSFFSLVIATILAFIFCNYNFLFKKTLFIIFCFPLIIPSYIIAYSYQSLAQPFGIEINGFWGTTFVLVLANYPLAFLFISSVLRQYDYQLNESAYTLGCNKWQTFWKVTFRQMLPAILSSGVIISLYTLSDFGTPALMNFATFTREIKLCYDLALLDQANTLTILLILIALAFVFFNEKFRQKQQNYSNNSTKNQWYPIQQLTGKKHLLVILSSITLIVLIFLPLGQISLWFQQGITNEKNLFSIFSSEMKNSIILSLATALLALTFCFPCAYFNFLHKHSKLNKSLSIISFFGNAIPGISLAFCVIFLFSSTPLYQTFFIIVFTLTLRFFAQAYNPLKNALEQIHPNHYESAQLLGKSSWQTFWLIIFPQVKNSITIGFGIVFVFVFKELAITLLMAPPGFDTLTQQVWNYMDDGEFSKIGIPIFSILFISSFLLIHLFHSQRFNSKTV